MNPTLQGRKQAQRIEVTSFASERWDWNSNPSPPWPLLSQTPSLSAFLEAHSGESHPPGEHPRGLCVRLLRLPGSLEGSGHDSDQRLLHPGPTRQALCPHFLCGGHTSVHCAPCRRLHMWVHVNSRTSEPPVAMMTHTLGNQETRARPFLLTPGSHEPAYTGAHHTQLPTLGHTLRPWASCRTCEYFMSGAGGCFSCSHTSHPPFHRLLFICLMNYLSVAPLPSRPPLPPGPRLHDLLNTAQLCGCHPKSQEPCWATELESSLCP